MNNKERNITKRKHFSLPRTTSSIILKYSCPPEEKDLKIKIAILLPLN
jgi:hypothetical protein